MTLHQIMNDTIMIKSEVAAFCSRIAEFASSRQHPTRAPAAPVDVGSRVGLPSSASAWTTIERAPMKSGERGSSETISSVILIFIVPPLDATLPKSPACLRNSYMYIRYMKLAACSTVNSHVPIRKRILLCAVNFVVCALEMSAGIGTLGHIRTLVDVKAVISVCQLVTPDIARKLHYYFI